jgi:hypothetical protein
MPLQKILFKPGVNRENTRYTTEGGWYDCDKIRFRQGTPEKIGGWAQISPNTYLGICRSLWAWTTLGGINLIGAGTSSKFYVVQGGGYNDITPIRSTQTLSTPFSASGTTLTVSTGTASGVAVGDYVTFSGAIALSYQTFTRSTATNFVLSSALATNTQVTLSSTGTLPTGLVTGAVYYIKVVSGTTVQFAAVKDGAAITTSSAGTGTFSLSVSTGVTAAVLNQNFMVASTPSTTQFTVTLPVTASTYDTGTGGSTVYAAYEVSPGYAIAQPLTGWGAGYYGYGTWGVGTTANSSLRIWNQQNFGQDLIINPRGGALYYWSASVGSTPLSVSFTINSQTVSGVNTGTDYITFSSSITAGTPVKFTSTVSLPSPLVANTIYYTLNTGTTTQLATTVGGSAIDLTTAGSGTITIYTPATATVNGSISSGTAIVFNSTGTLPAGISVGTVYYAANSSGATFNLIASATGPYLPLTSAGSGTQTISNRAIPVTSMYGASDVPTAANFMLVSDASRFTFAMGTTALGDTSNTIDGMLIRWSDQESVVNWTPAITNQAGDIRLSHGSQILTAVQTRQEILVYTDAALYSLQYLGPPYVWSSQLMADNISMAGVNTATTASNVVYWMGIGKFYKYDGRVQTMRCDLRQYIFQDINYDQQDQFFASTVESFNEVWWFYCSGSSTSIDKYVVYNYAEDIWYYGTMGRTAWMDSKIFNYPVAATYAQNLVYHEDGLNDNTTGTPVAIDAYISSSEFDIGDGHNFGFVWRILPDITFRGSDTTNNPNPSVTMSLLPLRNSGSGYNNPASEGGIDFGQVTETNMFPVEQFTGQINIRVRGRQMAFKVESNQTYIAWQLGAPRIDIKPDGRK